MSHSKNTKRGFSLYLEKWNPSAKKYINVCSICGCKGYSPVILEVDFYDKNPIVFSENRATYEELTKTLKPLKLDDLGRCEACAKVHVKHRRYLSVPKDLQAMYNDWYGVWNEQEHHIWNLTEEAFNALWKSGVFSLLYEKFDLIIDEYEDENIFYQKLFFIKDELFEKLDTFHCKSEIENLKAMINFAIEHKTLLSIVL